MSVRRSSRIKKLELDEPTRQKILLQPGLAENGPIKGRSIHAGKIRDLPYSRANGVNRLLRAAREDQSQKKKQTEGDSSPLRSVLGKLSDKFQEAIKGMFPFKLFSQSDTTTTSTSAETQVDGKSVEIVQRQSTENLVQSRSRSLEHIQGIPRGNPTNYIMKSLIPSAPNALTETEARRQAYAELSAFFTQKRGQPVGPADLDKVSHLFSTNISPLKAPLVPSSTGLMGARSGMLMTPLPRRMAAEQQQENMSRMASVQRIAPPPTTALKFRTRVPLPSFQPAAERIIVDEDVKAELIKSSTQASPLKESPVKSDPEGQTTAAMSQEPSPKKGKKEQATPNRFVGLFFLDPDEEEEELLRQERRAQEQQTRIETLVARKEQRERKIAFRVANEDAKKEVVNLEEAKKPSVTASLFDFGPSLTSTPRKEHTISENKPPAVSEEKPLISLATPVKPFAPMSFEFPSATTRIGAIDEDRESKRKRPTSSKPAESLFNPKPAENTEEGLVELSKPLFSFAHDNDKDKSADASKSAFSFGMAEKAPEPKPLSFTFGDSNRPAFSFGENGEVPVEPSKLSFGVPNPDVGAEAAKPAATFTFGIPAVKTEDKTEEKTEAKASAFSFTPATAPSTEPLKPSFSFSINESQSAFALPAKPVESTSTEAVSKPAFSFGTSHADAKQAVSLPTFTFPSATAPIEKPAENKSLFSFSPASTVPPTAETKPVFTFPGFSAATEPKPVPSFETSTTQTKPEFSFSLAPAPAPISFGQQPKNSEPAKPPTFSFNQPNSTSASFNAQPSTTPGEPKPFSFTPNTSAEPKSFSFGTSSNTKPAFNFGGSSAFGSATSTSTPFTFGSAPSQQAPNGMDMQMEDDGMAQPAPSSSGFGSASTTFGFGQPASTSATKPFSFATGPSPAPSSVTTPTFSFAGPSPTNQFTFGQNLAPASSPAPVPTTSPFNFTQPAQQNQAFAFGAQSSGMDTLASVATSGGFNVGAGGSVTGARKTAPMTRARRR